MVYHFGFGTPSRLHYPILPDMAMQKPRRKEQMQKTYLSQWVTPRLQVCRKLASGEICSLPVLTGTNWCTWPSWPYHGLCLLSPSGVGGQAALGITWTETVVGQRHNCWAGFQVLKKPGLNQRKYFCLLLYRAIRHNLAHQQQQGCLLLIDHNPISLPSWWPSYTWMIFLFTRECL